MFLLSQVRNFLIPVPFEWLLNFQQGLSFTASPTFLFFRWNCTAGKVGRLCMTTKDSATLLWQKTGKADGTKTFIQAMQNISEHLTYCKRKRGDIKHNLTETTNKYKVQNSVSKIKNVLIWKQWKAVNKPVVMQSLPTSLASKCSKLKPHIQSLNCK